MTKDVSTTADVPFAHLTVLLASPQATAYQRTEGLRLTSHELLIST